MQRGVEVDAKRDLEEYLRRLVKRFREEVERLPAEVKEAIPRTLSDLSSPCQVMVLWAKEPEFQIIVITRLKELEDEKIEIHGPIENSKLLDYIESQVLNLEFVKLIGREKVEDFLAGALRSIRNYYDPLKGPSEPLVRMKSRVSLEGAYVVGWLVTGSLLRVDVERLVDDCIKEITSTAMPSSTTPPPEEKIILEGFGTYMRPFVCVGEVPRPRTFKEKVMGLSPWKFSERAVTDTYKGFPVIILRDGYIAIGLKDKSKAVELLNEIMATLLLLGIPAYTIREADLGEAIFKEKSAWWSTPISIEAQRQAPHIVVEEEKLRRAIRLAELITTNERMKTLISLFHEAYTYFVNTEYKQALIMSWVILEDFYIEELLSWALSKMTHDEKRLSKIKDWSADQKIEALSISHAISNEEYLLLREIKKARNDVVHEGRIPRKELVESCLRLASNIVLRNLGTYIGGLLPKLF